MIKDKFYLIQENVEKTTNEIKFELDKIVKRPLIKKIYYKIFPQNEIKEFEIAFNYLKEKQQELFQYQLLLKELFNQLQKENDELIAKINELKQNKDKESLEKIVQLKMQYITNKEMIVNQIPVIDEMINSFLLKLEKALPHMESAIKKRIMINTSLKALSMLIDNVIELEKFAKDLEKQNSKVIEELVINSTEKIINSIDIEYYKNMKKRNEKLFKLYQESKEKYMEKLIELNNELDEIEERS